MDYKIFYDIYGFYNKMDVLIIIFLLLKIKSPNNNILRLLGNSDNYGVGLTN